MQHTRRFLPEILQLVHDYWPTSTRTCLSLLAEMSLALRDDFRAYVPELLPKVRGGIMFFLGGSSVTVTVVDMCGFALWACSLRLSVVVTATWTP